MFDVFCGGCSNVVGEYNGLVFVRCVWEFNDVVMLKRLLCLEDCFVGFWFVLRLEKL